MKVDIKDYELMKDMAYDNREKFQMLHAKMLLIKEGESTLKEMYYDLVEKYQRKNQECERFESRADELKNTLVKVNEKINRIVEIDGYSEQIDTKSVKKDKFIKNIKNWSQISVEYKNEASMYLDCADIPSELASEPNKTVFCDEIDSF